MTYHETLIGMLLLVILAPWLLHKVMVVAEWLDELARALLPKHSQPPKRSGASS